MERVLIADRGCVARRLIRFLREREIESVSVFSEPDVEQPWVEEADYAVYLDGRTPEETYLDPQKMVSAAMDAGADVIHPGTGPLAESVELVERAAVANVPVIGSDPKALLAAVDRLALNERARRLDVPVLPASGPLAPDDDGLAVAAVVGTPILVRSGEETVRVESIGEVPAVVERLRAGGATVHLERAVDAVRHLGTVVAGDRQGSVAWLATVDASLRLGTRTFVEECGRVVPQDLEERLGAAAVRLAKDLGWVAVARVHWAITRDGAFYLLGFTPRLTAGFDLVEAVQGVDLLDTQVQVQSGNPLAWPTVPPRPDHHAIQIRLLHLGPDGRSRPEGTVETLEIPDDVHVELGTDVGQPANADTDPLLAKLTVTGPTRQAALVRARVAVDALRVEGVATNLDLLRKALGDERTWRGDHDGNTLSALLR